MSKPILIKKVGSKYNIFVKGAPVVKVNGKLNFDRSVAGIGSDSLPILKPHNFTSKSDAEGTAHMIGKYILKAGGDFVATYTDYEK